MCLCFSGSISVPQGYMHQFGLLATFKAFTAESPPTVCSIYSFLADRTVFMGVLWSGGTGQMYLESVHSSTMLPDSADTDAPCKRTNPELHSVVPIIFQAWKGVPWWASVRVILICPSNFCMTVCYMRIPLPGHILLSLSLTLWSQATVQVNYWKWKYPDFSHLSYSIPARKMHNSAPKLICSYFLKSAW